MSEIRVLTEIDVDAAVGLTADTLTDIPLYEWVLGDAAANPDHREWLAGFLIEPLLTAGQVIGGFEDGHLVGLIGYQIVGQPLPATPRTDPDEIVRKVKSAPTFGERFVRLLLGIGLQPPENGAVDLYIAAVHPSRRRSGVVWDIMMRVEEICRDEHRRYFVWTGRPELRDGWIARFGLASYDTVELDGLMLYGLMSDNPPPERETL